MNIFRVNDKLLTALACAYHRAHTPVSLIARAAKLQPHTVRRNLDRLQEDGIVTPRAFIDVYRLGYTQFEVSYAIASSTTHGAASFLKTLVTSKLVAWVGEYSGEFQYVATVCCKTPQDLASFLASTTKHSRVTITNRALAVRIRYTEFPLRMLSHRVACDEPMSFGVSGTLQIDPTDHTMLSLLSSDASYSTRDLARALGLSQTAIQHRQARLEQNGIIVGYTYVTDFSKLGFQAFSIIVTTKSHTELLTRRILAFCKQTIEVSYLAESVGAYDYKIGVLLREPARINTIAQSLTESISDEIAAISTLTAFDYRKVDRYPF
jgi:DNA-binding Lrp family transcriptional regulator